MKQKKKIKIDKPKTIDQPFYHIFFALFPILFFISSNNGQVSIFDINSVRFILLSLILSLGSWLLFVIITKNKQKSAFIATLLVVSLLSYGHFEKVWVKLTSLLSTPALATDRILISLILISSIFLVWAIGKYRVNLNILTRFFNIVSITLVIFSLVNIAIFEFSQGRNISTKKSAERTLIDNMGLEKQANSPDIYYIIFDAFPRTDTLKNIYDYDNSKLDNFLKEKGFFVASKSTSNYAHTHFSLPSSLNMKYLNYLTEELNQNSNDVATPKSMIKDNDVVYTLKSLGYHYVHIGAEYDATANSEFADKNIDATDASLNFVGYRLKLNEYSTTFLKTTILAPFLGDKLEQGVRAHRLNAVNKVSEVTSSESPKFVFAHLTISHPAPLFDQNGNSVSQEILNSIPDIYADQKYNLDQNIFVTKKMQEMVTNILKTSKTPPVIIIQSDHGPTSLLGHPHFWKRPYENNIEGVKERMSIFNAYYFPDQDYGNLYETITPVNSFRIVFNKYFGGTFEKLEDKSYYSDHQNKYEFFDVTDKIR